MRAARPHPQKSGRADGHRYDTDRGSRVWAILAQVTVTDIVYSFASVITVVGIIGHPAVTVIMILGNCEIVT